MELLEISNRRANTRFREPGGRALCETYIGTQRFEIQDASQSGVALSGNHHLALGTQVSLQLLWPSIGNARAKGVVCRDDRGSRVIGVKYTEHDGLDVLLGNLFSIDRMRQTEPAPLFCGVSHVLSTAMQQLDEAGFRYWHAATPLEALRYLQDPWKPLTSTVYAPTPVWLEFSTFVHAEHSQLRRIVLTDSRTSEQDLGGNQGSIEEFVCEPWLPLGLYTILGLKISNEPCLCCGATMPATAMAFCVPCTTRSSQLSELDDIGGSG